MSNPRELLRQYADKAVDLGIDSAEAKKFMFAHRDDLAFSQMGRLANYVLIMLGEPAGANHGADLTEVTDVASAP